MMSIAIGFFRILEYIYIFCCNAATSYDPHCPPNLAARARLPKSSDGLLWRRDS
jgi:hypothetical protein